MNVDNIAVQMRKGVLEYCILLVIAKRDSYVPDIIAHLKESKLIVVEGTIYPILMRLKNEGLLAYRWEESPSGPPRKYYSMTETGHIFLATLESTWNELTQAVSQVKE